MLNSTIVRSLNATIRSTSKKLCRLCTTKTELAEQKPTETNVQIIDTRELPSDDYIEVKFEKQSVLEECNEDISHIAPFLKPTFNVAAYVNKSETLQQLVHLGVNLHKIEHKTNAAPFLVGLDFENDIKKYILLLDDLKVEDIGAYITKNPYFFKEDIDNLVVRINYLRFKKFSNEMITRIVSRNPFWLMFSTQRIDNRLGFFQKEYNLTGDEVRKLATKQPKLITYSMHSVKVNTFSLKEEMGFRPNELKEILLNKPILFMKDQNFILKTFEYVHNTMKIPLEMIAKMPEVLTCREFRARQRHMFLETLGKAQYNPKEPNYVSPLTVMSGNDAEFCENVAKSSIQAFNTFLKSM